MATVNDLARQHVDIDATARHHLRRLVSTWAPLADLSFSDLLLWAPVRGSSRLVVLGQIRPSTAQTVFLEDRVGQLVAGSDKEIVGKAFMTGRTMTEDVERSIESELTMVRVQAIPVCYEGQPIAVITRETRARDQASLSELERNYLGVFRRLAVMVNDGTFPFPFEDVVGEESPRVGDGAIILDGRGRVLYCSPNAVSAFHRLGYHGRLTGNELSDLGFDPDLVSSAYRLKAPVVDELERGERATIVCRIVPLLEKSEATGAMVMLRDVSDLRRRDRMLVSMDTTIREIHHRVKNNLQTVSSLLRIQGRRLESPEAKVAIEESVRRVASIAVVHEMLAKSGGDQVLFRDVLQPIVQMASAALVSPERPIEFRLVGEGPSLPASKASSLAVVVTELLQNAVEHGYPTGSEGGVITVELHTTATEFSVRVHDDGRGVDPEFDLSKAKGLGLTIISSLLSGELGGTLVIRPATPPQRGTTAQVMVGLNDLTGE